MRVDEKAYKQMPEHLKRLFVRLPNPGSEEVKALFPETTSGAGGQVQSAKRTGISGLSGLGSSGIKIGHEDSGSASRYFKSCPADEGDYDCIKYCPKASKAERNMGCEGLDGDRKGMNFGGELNGRGNPINIGTHKNSHPTVKPLTLMRYIVRLATPPGGTVLDPFAGSGTTIMAAIQEGFNGIGIEKEQDYVEIAKCRIEAAEKVDKQLNLLEMEVE